MTQSSAPSIVRERNRRKRLAGWVMLYLLIIALFVFFVIWQARRVNTLGFASGTLQLTTSKTKYTVGDTIRYTLKNNLDKPITFANTCPQEPFYTYSWTNKSWVRIHATTKASACAGMPAAHTIQPGGSYSQSFSDWPKLFSKPGIYRIVALATNYTALPYADFQVVAKPVKVAPQIKTQVVIQKVITPIYITSPSGGGGGGDD